MTTKHKKPTIADKPVWFITGCSTGFGRELAKHVLECGYRVVVTARHPAEVNDLARLGESLVLKLDVTNQGQINAAIKNSGPVNPVLRHGFYTRQKGAQFSCLQFLELGTLAFRTDSPFIYNQFEIFRRVVTTV